MGLLRVLDPLQKGNQMLLIILALVNAPFLGFSYVLENLGGDPVPGFMQENNGNPTQTPTGMKA